MIAIRASMQMCSGRRSPCPSTIRPLPDARVEAAGLGVQQRALQRADRAHGSDGLIEHGPAQRALVAVDRSAQVVAVQRRVASHGRERPVERAQSLRDATRIRARRAPVQQRPVEHPLRGQALHLDEPVDDLARAARPQAAVRIHRDRHGAEIDALRQPAVQAHLLMAEALARGKRAKVELRRPHRLLEFPRMAIGEEHPRHVRFDRLHRLRAVRPGSGLPQPGDLLNQRNDGQPFPIRLDHASLCPEYAIRTSSIRAAGTAGARPQPSPDGYGARLSVDGPPRIAARESVPRPYDRAPIRRAARRAAPDARPSTRPA
ncbi:hypothetical protein BTQ_4204 [Burkholderia thailandensis 2002721723]|nr:hypothetical protein BTQ_4204 [Burkholderia thailandensis 2002721723]